MDIRGRGSDVSIGPDLVAGEATFAIVADATRRLRQFVWVVARNTAELVRSGADAETLAQIHLLDMAGGLSAVDQFRRTNKGRKQELNRQPGPIIESAAAPAHNALLAQNMALLAHRLAEIRLQIG